MNKWPSAKHDTQPHTALISIVHSPPNMVSSTPAPQRQILLIGLGELGHTLHTQILILLATHITLGLRSPSEHTYLASPTTSLLEFNVTPPSATLIPSLVGSISSSPQLAMASPKRGCPSSLAMSSPPAKYAKRRTRAGFGSFLGSGTMTLT